MSTPSGSTLLETLQSLKDHTVAYGANGPLGLRSFSKRYAKSVVETLADLAALALQAPNGEATDSTRIAQQAKELLLEQEVEVLTYASIAGKNAQVEDKERQGIRGEIYLIDRDSQGRIIKRALWNLIVDYKLEDEAYQQQKREDLAEWKEYQKTQEALPNSDVKAWLSDLANRK